MYESRSNIFQVPIFQFSFQLIIICLIATTMLKVLEKYFTI